jgi:protein-L-isoaspartate(D-aspartate) O-methyltransferase
MRSIMARSLTSWLLFLGAACASSRVDSENGASNEALLERARTRMVSEQLEARGIRDQRVLAAMRKVPRHRFVPPDAIREAYDDTPLPIGYGQTISQPYIVGLMTELARPRPTDRALEIGTGSGYQAAVLSPLVERVYTIEYLPPLAASAAKVLAPYSNVVVREGDGYGGWPEHAPFDLILVTAAPEAVPQPLIDQLAAGGRLVIPVGPTLATQELMLIEKRADGSVTKQTITPVRFVPLRRGAQTPVKP